jgi:hypothetical protein
MPWDPHLHGAGLWQFRPGVGQEAVFRRAAAISPTCFKSFLVYLSCRPYHIATAIFWSRAHQIFKCGTFQRHDLLFVLISVEELIMALPGTNNKTQPVQGCVGEIVRL